MVRRRCLCWCYGGSVAGAGEGDDVAARIDGVGEDAWVVRWHVERLEDGLHEQRLPRRGLLGLQNLRRVNYFRGMHVR
jgi:hypothetical protein